MQNAAHVYVTTSVTFCNADLEPEV